MTDKNDKEIELTSSQREILELPIPGLEDEMNYALAYESIVKWLVGLGAGGILASAIKSDGTQEVIQNIFISYAVLILLSGMVHWFVIEFRYRSNNSKSVIRAQAFEVGRKPNAFCRDFKRCSLNELFKNVATGEYLSDQENKKVLTSGNFGRVCYGKLAKYFTFFSAMAFFAELYLSYRLLIGG